MLRRDGLLLLLLVLCSCTEDLPKPELIADLRILGVRAEPPEGRPGTAVALDALVVHPDPAASVERIWAACVAASGSHVGPEACALIALPTVSCAGAPEAAACLLGTDAAASYRLPAKALSGRAPGEPGQVFIILLAADGAQIHATDCAGALAGATVAAGCRVAAKRIAVLAAPAPAPNTNPTVSAVTIAGSAVTVTIPATAADQTPDGPEALFLSWYVTSGALDSFRTDATGAGLANTWTPADGVGTISVIVRDGRGGEGWMSARR